MSNAPIEKRAAMESPERIAESVLFTPLVDVAENNEGFIFQADLPGVRPGDVDVSFENGVLTIDGKVQQRQNPEQRFLWQEYGIGNFHRSFTIDTPIKPDGIRAEMKNGELNLFVPKAEGAKVKRIEIKGA